MLQCHSKFRTRLFSSLDLTRFTIKEKERPDLLPNLPDNIELSCQGVRATSTVWLTTINCIFLMISSFICNTTNSFKHFIVLPLFGCLALFLCHYHLFKEQ
ncbi:hypothetical protein AAZV13_18G146750 [Glycine max]